MSTAEKRLWRIAGLLVLAGAVITFLSYVYTWKVYYDTLPHSPDKATGRIYADNFHGFARYETRREQARLHTLDDSSEALVFLLILGAALHEWRAKASKDKTIDPRHGAG